MWNLNAKNVYSEAVSDKGIFMCCHWSTFIFIACLKLTVKSPSIFNNVNVNERFHDRDVTALFLSS